MPANDQRLPSAITDCLAKLRRQIRRYVWVQGLAIAIAWVGLAYWLGLALDYLPVLAGSSEMPRNARIVLLVIVSAVLVLILYRWILRRAFVRLHDRSLAVLLERRFPELDDTLLTAVSPAATDTDDHPTTDSVLHASMVQRAVDRAAGDTATLDTRKVLNFRPLLRGALAATVACVSFGLFAFLARDAWATWTSRFLLLSDSPWPRRAAIEVLDFDHQSRKVAEGSDLKLRVRADQSHLVPELCWIDYRLPNGDSGRANMSRDGEAREGFQYYQYDGAPFQGMLETVEFDVVGLDHRVSGFRVDVVPSPSIIVVDLNYQLPDYMNAVPRTQTWAPGTSLPMGTKVEIVAKTTKPLREVMIEDVDNGETSTLRLPDEKTAEQRMQFSLDLGNLMQSKSLKFELLDDDRVYSDQAYVVTISALEDLEPQVEMQLNGIGTAITPDAKLPMVGKITDDYRVKKSWFQINNPTKDVAREIDFDFRREGDFETTLDLRQQRAAEESPWEVKPGEKILLGIRATDDFDLEDQPHIGSSFDFPLDVVTADELLALLEARELGLKERFEQVLQELGDTRDSLLRLQGELTEISNVSQATESADADQDDSARSATAVTVRHLRVQRAEQQGGKSQQEVAGIAESFAAIRQQLINNRVDTPERTERLQEQIIDPLELIVASQFTVWLDQLNQLDQQLDDSTMAVPMSQQSVTMANDIIFALEQVLESMVELETYNELVELVRSIIDEQEKLQNETSEERKKQARGLLED